MARPPLQRRNMCPVRVTSRTVPAVATRATIHHRSRGRRTRRFTNKFDANQSQWTGSVAQQRLRDRKAKVRVPGIGLTVHRIAERRRHDDSGRPGGGCGRRNIDGDASM